MSATPSWQCPCCGQRTRCLPTPRHRHDGEWVEWERTDLPPAPPPAAPRPAKPAARPRQRRAAAR